MPVINLLEQMGYDIYPHPRKCERAIILCGKYENPTVLDGYKVLFYHKNEWVGQWDFFQPILEEYYDEMIDATELSLQQTAETIINETNKS